MTPNTPRTLWPIALGAAAMLIIGWAFLLQTIGRMPSPTTRHFVTTAAAAASVPFAWLLWQASFGRSASMTRGIMVPAALTLGLTIVATVLGARVLRVPSQMEAHQALAGETLGKLQRCLEKYAQAREGNLPEELNKLRPFCPEAITVRRLSRDYQVEYLAAPMDSRGRRPTYALCAQPSRAPDSGAFTFTAERGGSVHRSGMQPGARDAVACNAAWEPSPAGALQHLRYCALLYAVSTESESYPPTLAAMSPECLGPEWQRNILIRYVADAATPSGIVTGFRLHASCVGGDDEVVTDDRGTVLNPGPKAARLLLEGCPAGR